MADVKKTANTKRAEAAAKAKLAATSASLASKAEEDLAKATAGFVVQWRKKREAANAKKINFMAKKEALKVKKEKRRKSRLGRKQPSKKLLQLKINRSKRKLLRKNRPLKRSDCFLIKKPRYAGFFCLLINEKREGSCQCLFLSALWESGLAFLYAGFIEP
ncbi:MAG: hypothetical protein ACI9D5_002316 [Candidatus Endobugula sp.]